MRETRVGAPVGHQPSANPHVVIPVQLEPAVLPSYTIPPIVDAKSVLGLSARTLSYYGDTPAGMVESAFEFARICRKHDFHNFCFSMKASNPLVMVQAYRLLVAEMYKLG